MGGGNTLPVGLLIVGTALLCLIGGALALLFVAGRGGDDDHPDGVDRASTSAEGGG